MTSSSSELEPLVIDILSTSTIQDVVAKQKLLTAKASDGISVTSALLAREHISSLPVLDESTGKCIGLIDFSDIVAFLLNREWEDSEFIQDGDIWKGFATIPIAKAIGLSHRNPLIFVKQGDKLLEAVKQCAELDLRRMLVADEAGNVVAVLSPSQIMIHLFEKIAGRFDKTMGRTVKELSLGKPRVATIKKSQTLLQAMYTMQKEMSSVIAVVDDESGTLAGSISMSDIRMVFSMKSFGLLLQKCWDFIIYIRNKSDNEVFPYFGVSEGAKLQVVISKLLATNVHHMYVVDEKHKPVRIISFSEVCKGLLYDL